MTKYFIILSLFISLAAIAQQPEYPDSGFTNKAEAKNLTINGLKEGKWVEYCDSTLLIVKDTNAPYYCLTVYKSSTLIGIKRFYYKNGKLRSETPYVNGNKNGLGKRYYENGALMYETTYLNNKIIGIKDYDSNGNVTTSLVMPKLNKLSISIPPLSYIDPYSLPTYQVAVEVELYHNIALSLQGGGYFSSGYSGLAGRVSDVKGYMAKSEIKYYLTNKSISEGYYVSIEGVYKKQSFNWQDSIHLTPAYLTTFRDFKNVYCINLKYGVAGALKNGIFIDMYCGLGVRFKYVSTSLTPQQAGALKYDDDSNYDSGMTGQTVIPGNYVYPNFVLGFKIGYCIK